MKDFVKLVTKHSRKKSPAKKKSADSLLKQLIAAGAVLVLVGGLLLAVTQSLRWADFFSGEGQQTVLFFAEKVDQTGAFLVRFYFDDLQIEIYPIDTETPTEVMGGYGTYRFQAVYPLLELEGKELSYIRSTMSLSMGILLDELWKADVAQLDLGGQPQLKNFLLTHFWHNWQIPLGRKFSWLGLLMDQRTTVVVHQSVASLPASAFLTGNFIQTEPLCTVALVNTTTMNGLAGRIAQLLESHNFRVVRTVSDDTVAERTTAVTADEVSADCELVLDKVTSLVPGPVEREANELETVRNRADLVVKLGTDLVQ